ncbi:MAG: glycosyltransferase [Luteimonas sp.]
MSSRMGIDDGFDIVPAGHTGEPASALAAAAESLQTLPKPSPEAEMAGLQFAACATPRISIIIVARGHPEMTVRCLHSIQRHLPRAAHEILVVEDSSGDTVIGVLAQISGVAHHRIQSCAGYLQACNAAVPMARGELLFFLDGRTEVAAGWLDAALDVFERFPGCDLVGSMHLFADGRLMQAGALVLADGIVWKFGNGADPELSQFNYIREVDACAPAGICVRTGKFNAVGGFDTRYRTDTFGVADLALRLRKRGSKVYYCPRSRLIHDAAGATEVPSTELRQARRDQDRFHARWRHVLMRRHYRNGHSLFRARDHARHKQVVLVMDHTLPQPDRDAGSRAILQTMLQLARMGFVVKFWPDDQRYDPSLSHRLDDAGIETVIGGHWGGQFTDFLKGVGDQLDFAVLSRPNFAGPYIAALRQHSRARLAYFGHDLHFRRMLAQAEVTGDQTERAAAEAMFATELALWNSVDSCIYPSREEADVVADHVGMDKAHAVPLYFFEETELASPREPASASMLLFVACFGHPPNEDAAEWLVGSILPKIRLRMPEATLHLVGSLPTARVRGLAGPGVHVTGAVSAQELAAYYRSATVAVTPMRFGGGVKLKVIEAMAGGIPLVTTSVGAQGLPGLEQCVSVHDDPQAIADAVVALATDPVEAARSVAAARAYVREHYSAQRMHSALWRAIAGNGATTVVGTD